MTWHPRFAIDLMYSEPCGRTGPGVPPLSPHPADRVHQFLDLVPLLDRIA